MKITKKTVVTILLIIGSMMHPALALRGNVDTSNRAAIGPSSTERKNTIKLSSEQVNFIKDAENQGISIELAPGSPNHFSIRGKQLGKRRSFSGGAGLTVKGKGSYAQDAIAVLDNLSSILAIRDASKEFVARKVVSDQLGDHHVRIVQQHKGLRVVGTDLAIHFDNSNSPYQLNGTYISNLDIDISPKLDSDTALQLALRDIAKLSHEEAQVAAAPELVVFARNTDPVLAYELALTSPASPEHAPGLWRYWIDANTGQIVSRFNDIKDISAPTDNGSNATITGFILAGEGDTWLSVTGWHENSGDYYLYNKDKRWLIYNAATNGYTDNNTYAYRNTADWGISDPTEMSGAIAFDTTQDYYATMHGRNSYDNANAYARANVHFGTSYVNAFWDPDAQQLYFGDGDGYNANPLVVMDVVGHEFTHALTEHTANLTYSYESGALNESFSDVFGACVEFYAQPDGRSTYPNATAGHADWLLGEDCWLSATALRDMSNPGNISTVGAGGVQPTRYYGTNWYTQAGDNGGVHQNSGVQNLFFYLLCEGGIGSNDGINYNLSGIGISNAEQIAYRALTVYCTSETDYRDCRLAWISAAQDLNTNWVEAVQAAWSAVGVGPLSINQHTQAVFDGETGGAFSPSRHVFELENYGDKPIAWQENSPSWCTVSPSSGTLPPGQSVWVSLELTSEADSKAAGTYNGTIQLKNASGTSLVSRDVLLRVGQPNYYTELFANSSFDLDGVSMTFTPDGSKNFYSTAAVPITSLPVNTAGHTQIFLVDDDYLSQSIVNGATVKLYGSAYSDLFIGSNGYITFDENDSGFTPSIADHFGRKRISGYFCDLDPSAGGHVYWVQLADRVVVTYDHVPRWSSGELNTFQCELYFDGKITLSWLGINYLHGLVGLSNGSGEPSGFAETDLSDFASDYDKDGIPNTWELQYFSGVTNCIASLDSDGDGHINLDEYITGTDPLDPLSFFSTGESSPNENGNHFVIRWNAAVGRDYTIYYRPDLLHGGFEKVSQTWYPHNTYTDSVHEVQNQGFYKIEVQLQ